jgi:hypothetical protein
MEIETMLMVCQNCNNVYQYYDYLSHIQTCSNINVNTNSDMETENDNDNENENDMENDNENDNDMENDNENDNYNNNNNDNNNDNNMENDNINNSYMYSSYNGLNNYGHYNNIAVNTNNFNTNNINLYNSTLYRGFNTDTSINTNTSIDSLSSYLHSIKLKSGLDKVELFKYSKKEECNQPTDCPICLCSYPKKTLFYIMKCSHSFCINCCEEWFSNNFICPLCRTDYNTNKI